jgi:hypothetical protein
MRPTDTPASLDRRQDRRPAFEPLRSDRKLPAKHSRRTARSRAALQESCDPAHRCAPLQEGRDVALARRDAGIRCLGGADGSAAVGRALRKGCVKCTSIEQAIARFNGVEVLVPSTCLAVRRSPRRAPLQQNASTERGGYRNHAGTSRTLPSFQMIIGNPRRRSSARFFFVARRWA